MFDVKFDADFQVIVLISSKSISSWSIYIIKSIVKILFKIFEFIKYFNWNPFPHLIGTALHYCCTHYDGVR